MAKSRSQMIKEGLEKAKERGLSLGNPRIDEIRNTDTSKANIERTRKADEFAESMTEVLYDLYSGGIVKPSDIAKELNKKGRQTRRGSKWTTTQVSRLLDRLKRMKAPSRRNIETPMDAHDQMITDIFDSQENSQED